MKRVTVGLALLALENNKVGLTVIKELRPLTKVPYLIPIKVRYAGDLVWYHTHRSSFDTG